MGVGLYNVYRYADTMEGGECENLYLFIAITLDQSIDR